MFRFFDQRKQANMQWVHDASQSNVDNLNNVRRDASRHSPNKKNAYLKDKIEKLETNSKIKILGASMTLRITSLELI
jgi:hypothetical protein